ncbi:hypothetical protein ACP70R_034413 [Stipagrostis hirtigluma subsp. patula]
MNGSSGRSPCVWREGMETGAEWRRRRQWTLSLVTVAALLESGDKALLPAVYREVSAALGASPTALGSITLCRSLVQALCYPLATCAAARYDRARVIAAGAFLCAAATLLVGASATVLQMAIARGFNGVGLALVVPAIYSLVADYSDDATRGSAFGWVCMAEGMGAVIGCSLGVQLAPTVFLGVPGWRLAFHAVALISASLGVLTWLFAADPRQLGGTKATAKVAEELVREAKDVARVPTFWIVVAQGVIISVPWSALNFAAMWLELLGFTHWETTVITSLNSLATALGALCAGFVGDPVARRFPDTGRTALAQLSNAAVIPAAAVLLLALPGHDHPWACASYAAVFFVLGFAINWCPVTTNNPMFAEVVPAKARTTVYALDMCMETMLASFGAPVLGVLAERVFGYQPAASGTSAESDRENAAALGKAMLAEIAVPAAICCLTYAALYWTYPVDRERARMAVPQLPEASVHQDCDYEATGAAVAPAADHLNQALLIGPRRE